MKENTNIENDTELFAERLTLAAGRIRELSLDGEQSDLPVIYRDFFRKEALFLAEMLDTADWVSGRAVPSISEELFAEASFETLQAHNRHMYEEILPENYAKCYGRPAYAVQCFGTEMGQLLSALYAELRGMIPYAFEQRTWDMLVLLELFLEVRGLFVGDGEPSVREVRETLYWYLFDYTDQMMEDRTRELVDPSLGFMRNIILGEDLSDLRFLFRYGEYVTDNEKKTAAFLNTLSEEEIEDMARTWSEGYRIGFIVTGKDLSKKKTVDIRYRLGFERMVKAAIAKFEQMGLKSVIYRSAGHLVNRRQHIRSGCYGAVPNAQFEYDHRNDAAICLNEQYVTRKLQALQGAFERYKEEAAGHAGPAVMEVFGETPFEPQADPSAFRLTEAQQKLQVHYQNEAGQITNRYIIGSERSFTIIAYPVPEIGSRYEEIFRETVRINTLDYRKYQRIQQHLIDALDQGDRVRVTGMRGNCTDITVKLHPLADPEKETNFENCVADVNIPVGEVFTSPVLSGTDGLLHVSQVYLEDFGYRDLKIRVKDGMITEYSCVNFADEEQNRRYVEENILFHHPTLPIGEFAIGTNTTAYRMAKTFSIADKLPILIAEKMGPHFAFGDTCYSWEEDTASFNPDGKRIIAKENECSALRKTAPDKAYFGCHTDITIPYEELGSVRVIRPDGTEIPLILEGRFVLPGCEELNGPLEGLL